MSCYFLLAYSHNLMQLLYKALDAPAPPEGSYYYSFRLITSALEIHLYVGPGIDQVDGAPDGV